MYTVISWIIIVVSIFMIIVVLVQNSKGGGLAQNFAGQQQIMGVRKTTDFLEKATWSLAVGIMLLSFLSVALIPNNTAVTTGSELDNLLKNTQQQTAPAAPAFDAPVATEEAEAPIAE